MLGCHGRPDEPIWSCAVRQATQGERREALLMASQTISQATSQSHSLQV